MTSTVAQRATARQASAPVLARQLRALRIWLAAIAALIVAMILVGGATRLTNSGLSITEWQPIMGAVPPLSEADWTQAFEAYQKIPEYTEIKRGMSLEEFKTIYWWEWAHRFLGRLIGAAFFVPFVVFWLAGYIPRTLLPRLIGLFLLGGLQGAVGWYMVKSGLVDAHRCQPIPARRAFRRGAAHPRLCALAAVRPRQRAAGASRRAGVTGHSLGRWPHPRTDLRAVAGRRLVAGLDAGMGFNTWPLINGALCPRVSAKLRPGISTCSRTR